ncbi:MAG: hypothetical protein ACRCUC_08400, partial [Aestuariivirga sp.]
MPFVPDKPQDAAAPAVRKGFVPDSAQPTPVDFTNLDSLKKRESELWEKVKDAVPVPGGQHDPINDEFRQVQEAIRKLEPPKERSFMDDVGDFRITPDMDLRSIWKAVKGSPETAAGLVTNAGVHAVAGLTAPFVSENDDDAANFIKDFTTENGYTPYGDSARELTGALGEVFMPIENAKQGLGDIAMEATGSSAAATGAYMAPDILSVLFGPKPKVGNYGTMDTPTGRITTKTAAPPAELSNVGDFLAHNERMNLPPSRKTPRVSQDQPPVERARAAGIKVLPSDAERVTGQKPGLADRIAEAIAPEDVRREMTMENQGQVNTIAREKVKAPEGTRLNDSGIEKQKEPHFQTYEEVQEAINVVPPSEDYLFALDEATQRAGFPAGSNPTVTEVISALRTKARRKKNNPQADDKLEAEGQLAEQAADKLEEAMSAELKATGQEELLTKYQDARTALAELNDVKKSQRGGNVDPQTLRKLDKKNPGRMTGGTKLLADIAEDFPELKSSMSGAGKKGAGPADKEGFIKSAAKKTARGAVKVASKLTGGKLADRLLVESEGFQNRMGQAATPTERSYFDDYGKKPAKEAPKSEPPAGEPPNQAGVIPSKAVMLADRLELEPDAVPNAQQLPDKPDMLTADTVPRSRGDIEPEFDAQAEADKLAGEMGLDIRSGTTGTTGSIGKKELSDLLAEQGSDGVSVSPPRDMEQLEFEPKVRTPQPNNAGLTSPPKSGKLSSAIDDSGNITIRHADGGELSAIELPGQDVVQIKSAQVPKEARGQGRYQSMVAALIK